MTNEENIEGIAVEVDLAKKVMSFDFTSETLGIENVVGADLAEIDDSDEVILNLRYPVKELGEENNSPALEDEEDLYLLLQKHDWDERYPVSASFVPIDSEKCTPYVSLRGENLAVSILFDR